MKADAGTYGMGIMTVRDPKDLADLNRRSRNKMSVIKDGQEVTEVILQEGVPTYERVNDAVAEPVVYMIDRYVVGGFYRVNPERGQRRESELSRRQLRAARVRRLQPVAEAGLQARGERAEPVLHVRCHRPPGDGGGELRTRSGPTRTPRSTSRGGCVARLRRLASDVALRLQGRARCAERARASALERVDGG